MVRIKTDFNLPKYTAEYYPVSANDTKSLPYQGMLAHGLFNNDRYTLYRIALDGAGNVVDVWLHEEYAYPDSIPTKRTMPLYPGIVTMHTDIYESVLFAPQVDPISGGLICPYCHQMSKMIKDSEVYTRGYGRKLWACLDCKAWVGCHKDTFLSLGRLADLQLRGLKMQAHDVFDSLWKRKMTKDECSKSEARKAGYKWLSERMEIPVDKCHIGWFDVNQCKRLIEICKPYNK